MAIISSVKGLGDEHVHLLLYLMNIIDQYTLCSLCDCIDRNHSAPSSIDRLQMDYGNGCYNLFGWQ